MFEDTDHEDCDSEAVQAIEATDHEDCDSEAVQAIEARGLTLAQVEKIVLIGWANRVGINDLSLRVINLELIYALGIDTSSLEIVRQVRKELDRAPELLLGDLADLAAWTGNEILMGRIDELRS